MTPDDMIALHMRMLNAMTTLVKMRGAVAYNDGWYCETDGWYCEAEGVPDLVVAVSDRSDIRALLDVIESVGDRWAASLKEAKQ